MSASAAPRLATVVVLPMPPLVEQIVIVRVPHRLHPGRSTQWPDDRPT